MTGIRDAEGAVHGARFDGEAAADLSVPEIRLGAAPEPSRATAPTNNEEESVNDLLKFCTPGPDSPARRSPPSRSTAKRGVG